MVGVGRGSPRRPTFFDPGSVTRSRRPLICLATVRPSGRQVSANERILFTVPQLAPLTGKAQLGADPRAIDPSRHAPCSLASSKQNIRWNT